MVSLYIPCYNAQKFIKECLEGIFKQTYPIDEVLIIDDGSADDTAAICSQYPVRIISHKRNKGLAAARNTAFREAKNEFVASLDTDCVPRPNWLEELMNKIVNDNIAGAGGMLVERYALSAADKWRTAHMAQHWGDSYIEDPPFLYGSNTVFKKKAVMSVGFYNEFYKNNYEDADLSMRLSESGFKLIYNPKAVVEHLRRDTAMSVLRNYWQWDYYVHAKPDNIRKIFRRSSMHIGKIVYHWDIFKKLFKEDLMEKNYTLLPVDSLFLIYYLWLDFKYCFRAV